MQFLGHETEIEEITQQTNYLLAEELYSNINPQKFIDWAVILLEKGFETRNILVLAGLDNYPSEEIKKYFWNCVDDLNLKLMKSDFELLENYALYVANSVVSNKMQPKDGLKIMNNIACDTCYSCKYVQFYNLTEDMDYLAFDNIPLYNSFDKTDNIDEIIREEFKLFLEAEALNLDDKYREYAFCNKCQTINKPILKPKRNWLWKIAYNYWICPKCKSKELEHFYTQEGKRKILDALKKTTKHNIVTVNKF